MIGRFLAGLGILFLLAAIPACSDSGASSNKSIPKVDPKAGTVDSSGIKLKPG